jgi:hypothetical protein
MTRQIKNEESWHKFTMRTHHTDGALTELVLTGSGKAAYIWIGVKENEDANWNSGYVSGRKTLRKLAYAILKEVGK